MNDLISRQAAIKALQDKVFHNLSDEFYGTMQVLDELSPVDAEPVKHGHWKNAGLSKGTYKFSEIGKDSEKEIKININRAKCNICGNYTDRVTRGVLQMTPYCPYCGAKMDGGADNECEKV